MRPVRALFVTALLSIEPGCSPVTSAEGVSGHSILFVGNSLTYTNDLPAMVESIAEAAGDSVRVGMVAGPNMAVIDHTGGATEALAEIHEGHWAFVVLQQGPTPAGICRDTLVIAAMRLAPSIRAGGGRPAMFLPWARQAFPQSLGFAGESATAAARAVGGVVIPVGIAWKDALDADPELPLYSADGYHPAPAGTLLAALTVYDRLFGRGCPEHPGGRPRDPTRRGAVASPNRRHGGCGACGQHRPTRGPFRAGGAGYHQVVGRRGPFLQPAPSCRPLPRPELSPMELHKAAHERRQVIGIGVELVVQGQPSLPCFFGDALGDLASFAARGPSVAGRREKRQLLAQRDSLPRPHRSPEVQPRSLRSCHRRSSRKN